MKIKVRVLRGSVAGTVFDLDIGRAVIGSDADVPLPGDSLIASSHAELLEEGGQVVLNALDPRTKVNDKPVRDAIALRPGSRIHLGQSYLLEVSFQPPVSAAGKPARSKAAPLWKRGPLASLAVRLGLAAYLAAIAALAFFFWMKRVSGPDDSFIPVRASYTEWCSRLQQPQMEARLSRVDELIRKLQAFKRMEKWPEARRACQELMRVDGDPSSPVYQYGARQLGALSQER